MAETVNKVDNEAISNRTANTNLSKIGFEVYQPGRSGSSFTPRPAPEPDDAAPEEAFLEAWVNARTPDFDASSIPQADELARRYGFNAPLINGNLMRMITDL